MSENLDFEDELALENAACKYAEKRGILTLKIGSEATNEDGWPDRLFVAGASDIRGRVLFMVEFKDFGEKPKRLQRIIHEMVRRKYRIPVYVVDRWSRWEEVWIRETDKRSIQTR